MGSYMSAPVRDKESEDGAGKQGLVYGASCMQGWRVSQEDAHVLEPTFDQDAMLYVVFDGHGGSEVAKYAAQHLGNHLKSLQKYKEGRYEEALEEAFLTFDAMLKEPHILEILRAMAKSEDSDNEANASEGSEDGEDLEGLMDDADAPLSDIVERLGPKGLQDLLSKRIDMKALLAKAVEQAEAESDSDSDEEIEDEEDSDEQEEDSETEGAFPEAKQTRIVPVKKDQPQKSSEAKIKLDHLGEGDSTEDDSEGVQKVANGITANNSVDKNDTEEEKADTTVTTTTVTVSTTTVIVDEKPTVKRVTRSRIVDDDAAGSSTAGSSSAADSVSDETAGSSSGSTGNDDSIATLETDDNKDGDYRPTDEIDSDDDDEEEIDENEW